MFGAGLGYLEPPTPPVGQEGGDGLVRVEQVGRQAVQHEAQDVEGSDEEGLREAGVQDVGVEAVQAELEVLDAGRGRHGKMVYPLLPLGKLFPEIKWA